ncbi:MAG: Fic family protein [Burkholderiales bacterium]
MVAPKEPSGRYVPLAGGGRAFVPAPLPPTLEWTRDLAAAESEASLLLGRLSGLGAGLLNPHLLIRPFVRREAVLSSRIEGTQATLGELLADEAGAAVERAPDDLKEVRNYVFALEEGIARLPKLPLSLRLIKQLHRTLMKGVRGDSAAPGEFRRIQNWIGPRGATLLNARYVPPPPNELPALLDAWEKFMHDRSLPALTQAALLHYQFEAIHPFLDGNGRVGRSLITLFMIEREILPSPLLYLSAFFEASRRDYYDCLTAVSERSEWQPWLLYFLHGVAHQAKDALRRVESIGALRERWRRRLASRQTRTVMALLDRITTNPFVTVNGAAKDLAIAFTTAQRAIDALVAHKVLRQTDDARRGRVYVAKTLLDILDEPADLTQAYT